MVEVRDARAADGPILTELVRTSAAYDGEYRAVVANWTTASSPTGTTVAASGGCWPPTCDAEPRTSG